MKKISPYLGLYRSMFIVAIVVALVYGTINFFQYQQAMRELVIDNRPSVLIEREYAFRLDQYELYLQSLEDGAEPIDPTINPDKSAYFSEKPTRETVATELFQASSFASTTDLDDLWLNGLYANIFGSTITFLFAIAAIVGSLFALNNQQIPSLIVPLFLFGVFVANQVTRFLTLGLFGIYQYNQYFFNFLELIFILALIGLLYFTIFANKKQATH